MEKDILDNYLKAGRIANECLKYGASLIKPGVTILEVCDKVEEMIMEAGAGIAFPVQISLNSIAAHYCPEEDDKTEFKKGDVACIDVGVHMSGYVADNAMTVDLGNNKELVKASQDALEAALKIIKPGITLGEIGKAIQEAIGKHKLSPVKNLSGHGLDRFTVHTSPSIPNYDTGHDLKIVDDMVFAVEPFATNGAGKIQEQHNASVFMLLHKKPVRSPYARAILGDVMRWNGLPFTTRWLSRKHGIPKTKFGLKELLQAGIIKEYPPLVEVKNGLVSQAEHSVLIHEGKVIVYTKV